MPSRLKRYRESAIESALAPVSLVVGLDIFANSLQRADSIRDAVYAHADKITPEVIEQTEKLVSSAGSGELYVGAACIAGDDMGINDPQQ